MTTQLSLDLYASAGVGVAALLLGITLTKYVPFLKRFCIPSPVSGGLIVSLVTLLLYSVFGIECQFDGTIKDICMMLFFTSVGFQSDMRALRKGGKPLLVMIGLVSGLCGFGLGATPNAMANMSAVCFKYHYSASPFLIVPIIGAMFVDLINTGVITLFLNLVN